HHPMWISQCAQRVDEPHDTRKKPIVPDREDRDVVVGEGDIGHVRRWCGTHSAADYRDCRDPLSTPIGPGWPFSRVWGHFVFDTFSGNWYFVGDRGSGEPS